MQKQLKKHVYFALLGLLGIGMMVLSQQARAYCGYSGAGACVNNGFGVGYPIGAVLSPAPTNYQNLSPVERHAQWQYNQRRYYETNTTLRRVPGAVGSRAWPGRVLNSNVRTYGAGWGQFRRAPLQPYPRYSDYAYRQKRSDMQNLGQHQDAVLNTSSYAFTGISATPHRTPRTYITPKQARAYDKLYKLGVTDERRPKGSVVGKRPMPYLP